MLQYIAIYWTALKACLLSKEKIRTLSLYPEYPKKQTFKIRRELFRLFLQNKTLNYVPEDIIQSYFNMGLDRKGEQVRSYVFKAELDPARNRKLNPLTRGMLMNKWMVAKYLEACGVTTSHPLFVLTPFVDDEDAIEKIQSSGSSCFFAKPVGGTGGLGAFSFSKNGETYSIENASITKEQLIEKLSNYIVEPYIIQHPAMAKLYPDSVNSIRLVTVCRKNSIRVILRNMYVGAGKARVSNLHHGGLQLSINKDGELGEYGICTQGNRGRYTHHPDTGVKFKGYKIPYWKEVKEIAIRAHQCFPEIYAIGWDIAISEKGPLIIEANRKWGTYHFQYTDGPGRKRMRKYFNIK